jgi:cytochrome c553
VAAGVLAKGQAWYGKISFRCHGSDGRGNDKTTRVGRQQPEYQAQTLKHYRDGTGERIDPTMAANSSMQKDADIQALVECVSHMR